MMGMVDEALGVVERIWISGAGLAEAACSIAVCAAGGAMSIGWPAAILGTVPRRHRRRRDHVLHLTLAPAEVLDHGAGEFLRHVDNNVLDWLREDVEYPLEDHLRPPHLELVALPPHRLDQDRKMKLTPATHPELIR